MPQRKRPRIERDDDSSGDGEGDFTKHEIAALKEMVKERDRKIMGNALTTAITIQPETSYEVEAGYEESPLPLTPNPPAAVAGGPAGRQVEERPKSPPNLLSSFHGHPGIEYDDEDNAVDPYSKYPRTFYNRDGEAVYTGRKEETFSRGRRYPADAVFHGRFKAAASGASAEGGEDDRSKSPPRLYHDWTIEGEKRLRKDLDGNHADPDSEYPDTYYNGHGSPVYTGRIERYFNVNGVDRYNTDNAVFHGKYKNPNKKANEAAAAKKANKKEKKDPRRRVKGDESAKTKGRKGVSQTQDNSVIESDNSHDSDSSGKEDDGNARLVRKLARRLRAGPRRTGKKKDRRHRKGKGKPPSADFDKKLLEEFCRRLHVTFKPDPKIPDSSSDEKSSSDDNPEGYGDPPDDNPPDDNLSDENSSDDRPIISDYDYYKTATIPEIPAWYGLEMRH